jgi:GNAT superfamily N-acetyltransferase
MRSRLNEFKDLAAQTGVGNAFLCWTARALERLSARKIRLFKYYLMAQPISAAPLATKARASSIQVHIVDAGAPAVGLFPRPPDVIRQRFESGAICFAGMSAEKFVGFIWLKEGQYNEDEVRCRYLLMPRAEAVWDFDVYVEPQFRLGRAFSRLWDAAYDFMRSKGYRWSLSRVSAFNAASLTSHTRLGAVRVGWAVFLLMGPVQLALHSGAPYVHLALSTRQRLALEVTAPK